MDRDQQLSGGVQDDNVFANSVESVHSGPIPPL